MSRSKKILILLTFFCSVFFLAIILDISPYLRGPNDPFLESHWPYYFVNTFNKIWAPLAIFIPFILLFVYLDKKGKLKKKEEAVVLIMLLFLVFFIQLALVYFSRFGITILFRRLVDPGINGYFSTALEINNISLYLSTFQDNIRSFDQHARGHPPGSVLAIKALLALFEKTPLFIRSNLEFLESLSVGWASHLWSPLSLNQKIAALNIPLLLHFLAGLSIIPFYYLVKLLSRDYKIALRSTFLYSIIPSLSFFALIFDPIYAFFPIFGILLITLGVKKKNTILIFSAGITFGIGLFFSLSIAPVLFGLTIFILLSIKKLDISYIFKSALTFILGLFSVMTLLLLVGFNSLSSILAVIQGQAPRDYLLWVIYNPYDFLIFVGIPIALLFIFASINIIKNKTWLGDVEKKILLAFWITFLILIVSGISRGEVGRIWIPFMFIPVYIVGIFTTRCLKFSTKQFLIIIILLFVQLIIFEEYWVPIW